MSRRTLLDLLGTEQLPEDIEYQFVQYCIWKQAYPAVRQILETTGLATTIAPLEDLNQLDDLLARTRQAAATVHQVQIPVMAFGAVQGMAAETEQIAAAVTPTMVEADVVSFHAARLVGWATWSKNNFGTGMLKTTAEEVAYGEQLQLLMQLFGAQK